MSNQILVPSLGESITEATVSKWLKQVGENVSSDEPLVELETDKVNVEVPSPLAGTLSSIKVKEGDTVQVGALLGEVNAVNISPTNTSEKTIIKQERKSYTPPKTIKKKNINKENLKKIKKIDTKKQEALTLIDEEEEKSSNGTLILDTFGEYKGNTLSTPSP